MSKYLQVIGPLKGEDGKSAYQYAQDGGYAGTEAEFAEKLAAEGDTYTLPIASPTVLGGVKPVSKTDAMTQSVGVDDAGALWAPAASGGGGGGWEKIVEIPIDEEVTSVSQDLTDEQTQIAGSCQSLYIILYVKVPSVASDSAYGKASLYIQGINSMGNIPYRYDAFKNIQCIPKSGISYQTYCNVFLKHNIVSGAYVREQETAVIQFQNTGASSQNLGIRPCEQDIFTYVPTVRIVAEAESAFGAGSKIELHGLR